MDPDLSCSDSNHPCLGGVTGRILIGVSIPAWKEKDVTCHLNFPKVWSMTSLPVMPYNPTLEVIFPDAVIVYEYQKGIGYVRVTGEKELEAGRGY